MRNNDTLLAVIESVEAGLSELESRNTDVPDCTTDDGYSEAKKRKNEIVKTRTSVNKARLAYTEPLRAEVSRVNDMVSKNILPRLEVIEHPLKAAIKAVDDEEKRLQQEAAELEAARISTIEKRLSDIDSMVNAAVTLDDVQAGIDQLNAIDIEQSFDEFSNAATLKINSGFSALGMRKKQLEDQAAENERLNKQRIEQEEATAKIAAQKAELEAREKKIADEEARVAQEKREAEIKAETERQAEADALAAKEKAKADAEAAAAQAEADKIQAVEDAKQAERQKIADEKAAAEKKKAAAKRKAARAPDIEKLTNWLNLLAEVVGKKVGIKDAELKSSHADFVQAIQPLINAAYIRIGESK